MARTTRPAPRRKKSADATSKLQVVSQAEKKIRENERFLQTVFDGIQDGISVLDQDLNIVRVNHAMEYWYEHAMPLAGKKCFAAYHLRSEPCQVCPTINALKSGLPQMEEVPLTGPDGVRGWLELYSFPMYDEEGHITGAIEYVRNITQRKHAEAARRESEERLQVVMDNIPQAIFWKDRDLVVSRLQSPVRTRWRPVVAGRDRRQDGARYALGRITPRSIIPMIAR